MCGASLRSRMKRTTSSRSTGETWRSATATSAPTITSATAACSFRLDGSVISISIGLECLASDIVAPLSCEMTARSCDGDDWVGETLKKARRSADPSHSRGTGHPTSRGLQPASASSPEGPGFLFLSHIKMGLSESRRRDCDQPPHRVPCCDEPVLPHPLDKMCPRGRRLEPVAEILRLVRHEAVAEFHDAHDVGRHAVIGQHEFAYPEIVTADDAPN